MDEATMIVVTRLNGPRFAVNPDLLQRVESTPDTILTLIDGTKYIVEESLEEITRLVVEYRARVVAATVELTGRPTGELAAATELTGLPGGRAAEPAPGDEPADPSTDTVAPVTELRRGPSLRSVPEVD